MSTFSLRDYQKRGSDRIIQKFTEIYTTLLVWPTGLGKTVCFADVIRRMQPQRALVLAHRQELIFQARGTIESTTGLKCEIEMGEYEVPRSVFDRTQVIISTVQTQNSFGPNGKRMGKWKSTDIGLLVIDEAHRAVSPSYMEVIEYYKKGNLDLRILGCTAVPDRLDEASLGKVFESVADDYELLDAIHEGWLVPILQQCIYVNDLDYSHIPIVAGDLNGRDLAEVLEAEEISQRMAQGSLEAMFGVPDQSLSKLPVTEWGNFLQTNGNPKRTLVFTISVKQAEIMSSIFNRVIPDMSSWVCGKTADTDRTKLVQDFANGKYQVVCNVDCWSEGYDNPAVECVIMARATASRAKYAQQIGRGTRPLPGVVDGLPGIGERISAIASSPKKNLLVVDFTGNSGRHKLMTSADILSGNMDEEVIARAIRIVQKGSSPVLMTEVLEEEERKFKEQLERKRLAEEATKKKWVAKTNYKSRYISPFSAFDIEPAFHRGWHDGKVLSEKQKNTLRENGIDPGQYPYAQQIQLIGQIWEQRRKRTISFPQIAILQRRKIPFTPAMTMAEAKKIISEIAIKEHWPQKSRI